MSIIDDFVLGEQSKELIITKSDAPNFMDYSIRVAGVTEINDTYLCARKYPLHHTLVFTLAGQGRLTTPAGDVPLLPNSLIYVPSQEPFCYQLGANYWEFMWFIVEDDKQWHFLKQLPQPMEALQGATVIKPMLALLAQKIPLETKRILVRTIYQTIMAELKAKTTVNAVALRLEQAFAQIDTQLHGAWQATDIAKKLHCSESTLHRQCQKVFNQSPLQRVIEQRIKRACVLLEETDWTLDIIASQLGYSSGLSLSKVFKQKMSITPAIYKQHLNSQP